VERRGFKLIFNSCALQRSSCRKMSGGLALKFRGANAQRDAAHRSHRGSRSRARSLCNGRPGEITSVCADFLVERRGFKLMVIAA
jgi:hypothetical protein